MTRTTAPLPEAQLRPAGQATRAAILGAAKRLFGDAGFHDVSVRAIAAEADVDPSLVVRHFGSKEALFLATIETSPRFEAMIAGPLDELGRRLVEHALSDAGASTRRTTVALMQASHLEQVRAEMERVSHRVFIGPLTERLEGDDREARAAMVWSQFTGLVDTLALSDDPVLLRHRAVVVETYGASLQRLITP